jgi:hypothetical protein
MDIATVIGLLDGTALIVSAIFLGGSALIFFNIPGRIGYRECVGVCDCFELRKKETDSAPLLPA